MVRVAVIQAPASNNVSENLERVLRLLDEAGALSPRPVFVVLPEFVNHLSWYSGQQECFDVSVDLTTTCDSSETDPTKRFLSDVAAKAIKFKFFVHLNCTVRREGIACTGTNIMIDPSGAIVGTSNKQVLMGHENDYLTRATEPGTLVETPFGRVGMYCCMDGVICEPPRALALRGCHILSNSLNSFGIDEGTMHVPVRAAENRVWVLAANKCGPLIPDFLMDPVSAATAIPKEFLCGAGDAQIVAPDGTVVAHAKTKGEEIVFADIDPDDAIKQKRRPDGTDVFASRRPELYTPLYGIDGCAEAKSIADAEDAAALAMMKAGAETKEAGEKEADLTPPAQPPANPVQTESNEADPDLKVAVWVFSGCKDSADFVAEAAQSAIPQAASAGVDIVVFPELFCFPGSVVPTEMGTSDAAKACADAVAAVTAAIGSSGLRVATSIVEASGVHSGVLIGSGGIEHSQPQLHACARHAAWNANERLGSEQTVATIALEGASKQLVGDDALYPESVRLAALQGAELVLAPLTVQESWELEIGLRERAAENRVALVAASHTCADREGCKGVAFNLPADFTLMTPWKFPDHHMFKSKGEGLQSVAPVCLANSKNKVISRRTHLLGHRPYTGALVEALVSAATIPKPVGSTQK